MKTIIFIIFSLSLSLISCLNRSSKKIDTTNSDSSIYYRPEIKTNNRALMDSLKNCAILNNDNFAYNEVAIAYFMARKEEEILYLSLNVANKYDNKYAHFHIYMILNGYRTGNKLDSLDAKTKNLALYHLLKSKELGLEDSEPNIEEIFGISKIPKSSYYLNEYVKECSK